MIILLTTNGHTYPSFSSLECFLHKDKSSPGESSISCFNKMSVKKWNKTPECNKLKLQLLCASFFKGCGYKNTIVAGYSAIVPRHSYTHLLVVQSSLFPYFQCQCFWRISECAATADRSGHNRVTLVGYWASFSTRATILARTLSLTWHFYLCHGILTHRSILDYLFRKKTKAVPFRFGDAMTSS